MKFLTKFGHFAHFLGILGFGGEVFAQSIAFDQLSEKDANQVIAEFSGNFTETSVSGASPLAEVFGFDVGAIYGRTKTPRIGELASEADPSTKAESVPHGGFLAMMSVPYGVTIEGTLIPNIFGNEDFNFHNLGLGVKWTLSDSILELPFSLALKAHYMATELSFDQNVFGQPTTITFDDKVLGLSLLVSHNWAGVVEPFVGIGFVHADGHFSLTGAGAESVFSSGAQHYSSVQNSTQFLIGAELLILFVKLGAEYSRQFGVNRYTLKAAFTF